MAAIVIKSRDNTPSLDAQLFFANGNPIDLTGTTVTLQAQRIRDGGEFFKFPVTVINAMKGQVSYNWQTPSTEPVGEFLRIGQHQAAWVIDFNDGTRLSVPNTEYFAINVIRSLDDPE